MNTIVAVGIALVIGVVCSQEIKVQAAQASADVAQSVSDQATQAKVKVLSSIAETADQASKKVKSATQVNK